MESLENGERAGGGTTSPPHSSNNWLCGGGASSSSTAFGGESSRGIGIGGGASSQGSSTDLDMAALNDMALSESLDAFLSNDGDDDEQASVAVAATTTEPPQAAGSIITTQQPPHQQTPGVSSTQTGALVNNPALSSAALSLAQQQQANNSNTILSLSAQMGLVAAAGAAALSTNPFLAAAMAANAATAATTTNPSSLTATTNMPAPAPVPLATKNSSVASKPQAASASALSSASSSSSNPPAVPTLFGKAISLPPMGAPAKPLQLSPWEIQQAKRKGTRVAGSSSVPAVPMSMGPPPMSKPRARKRPRMSTTSVSATGVGSCMPLSMAVSEDEADREQRRKDRNQREQHRSQQITNQIDHLRQVLSAANVQFKPDKYSTLATVVKYIKELQERSAGLDEEHSKLLETITQTTEIMNSRYLPASTNGTAAPPILEANGAAVVSSSDEASVAASSTTAPSDVGSAATDPTLSLLQGVDFKFIFQRCPVASAITSIDGRFLDCNEQFEDVCGFTRAELLMASERLRSTVQSEEQEESVAAVAAAAARVKNLSLFNILLQSDMERVYTAMSQMLQRPLYVPGSNIKNDSGSDDMWAARVSLCRKDKADVRLTLSLVRSAQESRPRFFNCVIIPKDDNEDEPTPD